jgi:serine/threonine protein kinase
LSSSSTLVALTERSTEPLEIDLENPGSLLRRLSLDDQQWLADGAFRLLVPLIASEGRLIGLIALGEKKSELGFSREDRILLKAIAASVALTLENRFFRAWSGKGWKRSSASLAGRGSSVEDKMARECQKCRALLSPRASSCSACGGEVETAQVPYILLGKFRLERKIGSGGMGVVYRAVDLVLGRAVAIKTLPRVSPEYSMRLRREARAMAAVVHPNLALIFGAETWRGTPMLIFEYLNGGTLADRLRAGPLPLKEALQLGIILASVLERTHAAGILHRDIKPSNIGYTTASTPKLLDFGLAHVLDDSRREARLRHLVAEDLSRLPTVSMRTDDLKTMTATGHVVGTPVYLSPEGVRNSSPDPSFDLWAVAIVLYEAMTGQNPMVRASVKETLECISQAAVPDIRHRVADCPEGVAAFFKGALARDRSRRPATAEELGARLQRVLAALDAHSAD